TASSSNTISSSILLCNALSQDRKLFCFKHCPIWSLTMLQQDMWNAPPGFRPSKSAPSSPAKPLGAVHRTRSESFHVAHKVPVGDSPYVRAKNVQLVDKDPERAIPLFWAAINAGDRVDSALKDMAIVMKQQNRADEAIEAIKSLRSRCSDQAQESLDNILLDLYKRCGRLDDQIALLKHKLFLIQQGLAFNGKRTKTARSQGKKFQVSVEQEATRLLGNLGWALMQQNNYIEAEEAYRRALSIAPDNNKMCNLGICLMKQGRIGEAKETLYRVKPAVIDGPRGSDSHLKAYERAQQMLKDLESEMMNKGGDRIEQSRLFEAFLGSSSIWQPQPCKDHHHSTTTNSAKSHEEFADENINSNIATTMTSNHTALPPSKGGKLVAMLGNSLNVAAPPFYASKSFKEQQHAAMLREPIETLKRTRSGNAAGSMRVSDVGEIKNLQVVPENNNKTRRLSSEGDEKNKLTDLLPDDDDFEEAILAAILGPPNESDKANDTSINTSSRILQRKTDKRLKVFQDITLSLSPRA
ncbi:Protein POLLENLESS 3-LIKE 2, partial [Mucuna pruriens]